MAQRYGHNDAVALWHLDNEFGNHEDTRSYDVHARNAFRRWLRHRYGGSIAALNAAQGRVFWSSQYDSFDDIELPTLEQTESSPALRLDFYHFSSDQLIDYAVMQAETIRKHSDKPITTNLMPFEFSFDHHELARRARLDVATWDSYPLGNCEVLDWVTDADKIRYARTGRPDAQALQHALYRGVAGAAHNKARGPWGVMEQQPGPVNWATNNPSPAPGMVRLWLHDMLSQGSSLNNIFRWRQVPFGQEQMHAGMFRPDNSPDAAFVEQQAAVDDVAALRDAGLLDDDLRWTAAGNETRRPQVAIVMDYPSVWALEANPQGGVFDISKFKDYGFQYAELLSEWHAAFRRLAVDVDVVGPATSDEELARYRLLVVPTMVKLSKDFEARLDRFPGDVVVGPRFASKVDTLSVPLDLPPSSTPSGAFSGSNSTTEASKEQPSFAHRLPMRVTRVESIRKDLDDEFVVFDGKDYPIRTWVEWLECARDGHEAVNDAEGADALSMTLGGHHRKGAPVLCQHRRPVPRSSSSSGSATNKSAPTQLTTYVGFYATADVLLPFFAKTLAQLGVRNALYQLPDASHDLGAHLRLARHGERALFAFNYDDRAAVDLGQWPHLRDGLLSSEARAKLVVGQKDTPETIAPTDVQIWDLGS